MNERQTRVNSDKRGTWQKIRHTAMASRHMVISGSVWHLSKTDSTNNGEKR